MPPRTAQGAVVFRADIPGSLRAAWLDHDGELPVIDGTLVRLIVDHLPGDRNSPPVWLWFSRTGATPADVDRCSQSF